MQFIFSDYLSESEAAVGELPQFDALDDVERQVFGHRFVIELSVRYSAATHTTCFCLSIKINKLIKIPYFFHHSNIRCEIIAFNLIVIRDYLHFHMHIFEEMI